MFCPVLSPGSGGVTRSRSQAQLTGGSVAAVHFTVPGPHLTLVLTSTAVQHLVRGTIVRYYSVSVDEDDDVLDHIRIFPSPRVVW